MVLTHATEHPNLTLENSIHLGYLHLQVFIEYWVFSTSIYDSGGESLIRVVCKRELSIHILIIIDAYVMNVPSMMNIDIKNP